MGVPNFMRPKRSRSTTASPLPSVLSFAELRANTHLHGNEYIHQGYFIATSATSALAGLLTLHNETVNIWSHLLGLLYTLYLLAATLLSPERIGLVVPAGCSAAPTWPLLLFLCGAAACLLLSVLFHALGSLSQSAHVALNVLDYCGISLLICASSLPPIFYLFSEQQPLTGLFYAALSLLLNAASGLLGTLPSFRTPSWRLPRAAAFIAAGLLSVAPLLHFLALCTQAHLAGHWRAGVALLAGCAFMGAQYIVGALLFGLRIPERLAPGRFDLLPSHAWFHVLVVSAVLTHWETLKALWLWRSC